MEPGREEIHLLDYWRTVVRRRWTVGLIAVSVTLAALVGSLMVTPLYRGTVTLQIERRNPEILTFRDLSQIDYSWAAYTDFYQTQYRIISSEPVARRTVERLGLLSHPLFRAEPSAPGLLARLRGLLSAGRASAEAVDPLEAATARVLAGLQVAPVRNSHLVKISWVSPDPELAALVANGAAEAYIRQNMEAQFSTSGQAEEFLVTQIGTLKREIAEMENRLQSYGESKRIVSIDDSSNITLQALQDISERRTQAQTALATAEARYAAVRETPAGALPEVTNSDLINQLRREHALLEAEISEKAASFGERWPGLRTLRSKLEQAARRLEAETERIAGEVRASAKAAYLQARSEVDNLDRLVHDQEEAAQRLKRDAVEFANLQSEVQKRRETLDALLSRRNEMELSTRLKGMAPASGNIQIVERAKTPPTPFRPRVRLNVFLGLVFGLLGGAGLALLLDHLDNTVSTPDELRRVVPLPVLAVVPRHGGGGSPLARVRRRPQPAEPATGGFDLVTHHDAKAGASEAYRDLRTAILLSNPGSPPRRILVTSAMPEEGKTATAINLAVVLAQLGARVLLVDTDLRRPRLHRALGTSNGRGLSNCLSGLEEVPTSLALPTGVPHLDLLPSGPVPPNPSELLNSPIFVSVVRTLLDGGYDHVLFDSPPVLSVSDPVIIANTVDSCVLVVRAGRTPRQSVRAAVEKLHQVEGVTFGIVLNDLNPESRGWPHYGYYGYRSHDRGARGDGSADRRPGVARRGAGA